MSVADLTKVLDDAGAEYEVLHHGHTERAVEEAEALGLDAAEVAKTLIARTPDGYLRALVPASERVDMRKLREAVGGSKDDVQLATEAEMAQDYPEFALGAVPPLGGTRSDPVFVDRRLAGHEWVVFEAGTHDDSVRVRTEDLLRIAQAQTADLCED
jgi:Ala-tRNA(Pro) deacylase